MGLSFRIVIFPITVLMHHLKKVRDNDDFFTVLKESSNTGIYLAGKNSLTTT